MRKMQTEKYCGFDTVPNNGYWEVDKIYRIWTGDLDKVLKINGTQITVEDEYGKVRTHVSAIGNDRIVIMSDEQWQIRKKIKTGQFLAKDIETNSFNVGESYDYMKEFNEMKEITDLSDFE